jgi:hypothetical protein
MADEYQRGEGYRRRSQQALEYQKGESGLLSGGELAHALDWWNPGAPSAWRPSLA